VAVAETLIPVIRSGWLDPRDSRSCFGFYYLLFSLHLKAAASSRFVLIAPTNNYSLPPFVRAWESMNFNGMVLKFKFWLGRSMSLSIF